ncbi:MAG: hypothetical protein IPI37_00265 [Bacteroidales bacterium]|nr:hypothetical protein [Bacteroidales bacterium]
MEQSHLEYGFDTLLVTELVIEGSDIRAEVYRMKDHEAAFAYSPSHVSAATEVPRLTEHLCRSAYQSQFCKGPAVSIINDTGSDDDQKRPADLAKADDGNIVEPSFDPSQFV